MATQDKTEPFPTLSPVASTSQNANEPRVQDEETRPRRSASTTRRTRGISLLDSFVTSNPPLGFCQATGEVSSKVPTLPEIRDGSFTAEGWSQEGQMERRGTNPHDIHRRTRARRSSASTNSRNTMTPKLSSADASPSQHPPLTEETAEDERDRHEESEAQITEVAPATTEKQLNTIKEQPTNSSTIGPDETGMYPNGYRFPKKHTFGQSCSIGMKAFGHFFLTPLGFMITVYGLLVVGWGAMIFFVLLCAVPGSWKQPSCSSQESVRSLWVEIDSQVLNGLFCVTGFGLIPWRFRDLYYLMKWRIWKDEISHRRLAGINRGWYRLPGSQDLPEDVAPPVVYNKKAPAPADALPAYTDEEIEKLEANPALPLPATSIPDPPLTGIRAQPTAGWNLDLVIWMYVWNTFIQAGLAGAMWGLNRYNRPSAVTGILISVGCVTGMVAGWVTFKEGSKVKKAEGIPVQEYDVLESIEDYQNRKAKEDAKTAKKDAKDARKVERTEKVKGENWFVRH